MHSILCSLEVIEGSFRLRELEETMSGDISCVCNQAVLVGPHTRGRVVCGVTSISTPESVKSVSTKQTRGVSPTGTGISVA